MNVHNYHFPAEWSKQQAILITWPDEQTIWKDSLADIEPFYVQFASAILTYEDLVIVCRNPEKQRHILKLLPPKHNYELRFFHAEYNDIWIRDYGPISLVDNQEIKFIDFGFNAWGGKYRGDLDDKISEQLYAENLFHKVDNYARQEYILEGGAIETDGLGTLLTSPCAFTTTRNKDCSRFFLEEKIMLALNIKRLVVIEQGYLSGDDTDGHIDTLVRFCNPHTLAYTSCDDPSDEHYAILKTMEEQVLSLRDLDGKPYTCIPLPIPAAKFDDTGRRLPASYANFLIINNAVLCPTYDDPNDAIMLERLKNAFPDRELVPVPSLPLVQFNGALHCASMQIPQLPENTK